jgi:predicted nucleic acid-binding protein
VIFVDSNVFVIDLRYPDDAEYRVNRRALDRLARDGTGMTSVLNVLELCGILSFNLSVAALHALYAHFAQRYRVTLIPGGGYDTRLPAPAVRDVLAKMERRMALKDAEIALAVEQQAANLSAFVSWNAKHFAGKLSVPALTPREWLHRRTDRRKRPDI